LFWASYPILYSLQVTQPTYPMWMLGHWHIKSPAVPPSSVFNSTACVSLVD
jgi:hypothetical protein